MASKLCNSSHLYSIIFISLHLLYIQAHSVDAESDRLALLSFKNGITDDPLEVLSSWNDSASFCNWTGVTCSSQRSRVVMLSLPSRKLGGSLSPAIVNMTFLTVIDLSDNFFQGQIPRDIGRLVRLRNIFLMRNAFEGEIPANLSRCTQLRVINFNYNNLTGRIPADISTLPNLIALHVSANGLTGGIPPVIGNISSLLNLSIAQNYLGGVIPDDLGRLINLEFLQVSNSNLSGTIPGSIFNLSRITFFAVALNQLTGSLPSSIGSYFPNLKELHFGINGFSGGLPFSLSNISSLMIIDIPDNKLTGKVPSDLGRLPNLQRLNVGRNLLGSEDVEGLRFIDSLINCSNLETLSISGNRFSGPLPDSIGNLSVTMKRLLLSGNSLSGEIPSGITNLINLNTLNVSWNQFDGPIFPDIDKLFNLRQLYMNVNRFSGRIPPAIGNLTELFEIRLDRNELAGDIPANLGDCKQLKLLNLSDNNLSGSVPSHVFGLSSLTTGFNLARNTLSGSLPVEVGNFVNLKAFDVSDNEFSGRIPDSLGLCSSLESLFLDGNSLQGSIPSTLSELKNLQDLDLSRNNMTGRIPEFLQDFVFLVYLNLSYNDFAGEVPKRGIFANTSRVSMYGNSRLCGGVIQLELPSCPAAGDSPKRGRSSTFKAAIGTSIGVFCLLFLLFLAIYMILKRSRRKGLITSPSEDWSSNFSYNELAKATDGFLEQNLLGQGGFASVYKGTLSQNGKPIAVKVLNAQHKGTSKTYMSECEALRNIKHRNLVKILGSCSALDSMGQDFKAIVLDFMPNGSLEKWLHPNHKNRLDNLDILQRLNIAIDVASALEYLHYHSHIPVAHCDLKPANVLLDTDFCAHLGDFGLAKFIKERVDAGTQAQINSTGIKGSFGYVAPEYGKGGPVSITGDVYSFGILLLEMFTGKKPTDEMFTDGLNLHNLAEKSLCDNVMDIMDPRLKFSTQAAEAEATDHHISIKVYELEQVEKLFMLIIRIGVSCSQEMPKDRMNIKDANVKLQLLRDNFL
ncbi:receptor-like protein kinase [Dorcoceras hygrometricum]|uniref:non-specific serine/threonine protein kinase n=1 Tax=Dorcoceras hygrometricum TaxID=472368 RepID=A0A2Z7APN6_9LAMI|nr:receptor-like protein kinase [Dorcoceras hygrometricum]